MQDGEDLWNVFAEPIEDAIGIREAASNLFPEQASKGALRGAKEWLFADALKHVLQGLSNTIAQFKR